MPQLKSTMFSAAKVANSGVVMAEMMGKMSDMEKKIKRLRHHVSVLSKRNHELVKNGKGRAASPIASNASLSSEDVEVESEIGVEDLPRQRVVGTLIGEKARDKAHGDGVPDPWCEEGAKKIQAAFSERDRY